VGLLAWCVLLAALAQASVFGQRWDCFDFYQFWAVGQAVAEPETGNVWSTEERRRLGAEWLRRAQVEQPPQAGQPTTKRAMAAARRAELETYSTPWLYTLFGRTASGDYPRDLTLFQHVSLASFTLAVLALARIAGLSWSAGALLAAFLITWFAPTLSDTRVGNVNRLQAAALGLYLWIATRERLPWRDLAAGVVLGAACMFKPNLAFPAAALGLGWIVLGRWRKLVRQVGGAALGALAAFALSSAWFGTPRAWSDWSAVLGELMGEYDHALSKGNFALARLLEDFTGVGSTGLLALVLFAALAGALVRRRRVLAAAGAPLQGQALEDLALVGLGGALSVLTAKLAWVHYFMLVVPLCVLLLRPGTRAWMRVCGAVGLVLVAHEPLKDLLRLRDSGPAAAALVCTGTALLFGVALCDLARSRTTAAATATP
jgi:hypothetical protein